MSIVLARCDRYLDSEMSDEDVCWSVADVEAPTLMDTFRAALNYGTFTDNEHPWHSPSL